MKETGFTLVELLITVVIAAILFGVAIPAFQEMIQNNRVVTFTNDLVTALNLARSEAVKRNDVVQVSPGIIDYDDNCSLSGGWSDGWVVWIDIPAGSPAVASGDLDDCSELMRDFKNIDGISAVSSSSSGVAFEATGSTQAEQCFAIVMSDATTYRRVEVKPSGGVVVDINESCT